MSIAQQTRRIIASVVFAVLLTGLVVAAAVSLPLLNQIQTQTVQTGIAGAQARATAFSSEFARLRDIAEQPASRSEIANRLEEYVQDELSRDELVRSTRPRLADALGRITDVQAMMRLDHRGREVVRLGPLADQLPQAIPVPEGLEVHTLPLNDGGATRLFILTTAPVLGQGGQPVGQDVLLFSTDALGALFVETEDFGPAATICLVNRRQEKRVHYDRENEELRLKPLGDCLARMGEIDGPESAQMLSGRDAEGMRHIAFLHPLEDMDWDIRIRMPANTFYGGLHRDAGLVLVMLLILMAAAGWLASRALGPLLHRLAGQAEQIQRANVDLLEAASVFEQSQEAIVITDRDGIVMRANPGFADMLGYESRERVGTSLLDLVDFERSQADLLNHVVRCIRVDHAWQGEVWYRRLDGTALPALQTCSAVRDEEGNLIRLIHVFNDISERMRAERHMQRLAHYDELTGLPNRSSLEKHLADSVAHAAERQARFAVLFLDLDKFKPVNDSLGHQAGDHLLKRVGQRLRNAVRSRDIIGRLGGDEFLLVTDELRDADDAAIIAGKIIASLEEPFQVDSRSIEIGVSIGVAVYPMHGTSSEALIKAADKALYTVKNGGRGYYAFADTADAGGDA